MKFCKETCTSSTISAITNHDKVFMANFWSFYSGKGPTKNFSITNSDSDQNKILFLIQSFIVCGSYTSFPKQMTFCNVRFSKKKAAGVTENYVIAGAN